MVAARLRIRLAEQRQLRRAAKFSGHHDKRTIEQAARLKIVKQRTQRVICRRKEFVLQAMEDVAVIVPRFVAAKIHLNEVDSRFDQPKRHQERPSKTVATVAKLSRFISVRHIERSPHITRSKQRDRRLTMIVIALARSGTFEFAPLKIEFSQKTDSTVDSTKIEVR